VQVNIFEAKNRPSELIKAVQACEEVVIANRGQPVAKLVAVNTGVRPERGTPEALLHWLRIRKVPERRRTAGEIDTYIEEQRASWD
jgi:prevent-host-death family protein